MAARTRKTSTRKPSSRAPAVDKETRGAMAKTGAPVKAGVIQTPADSAPPLVLYPPSVTAAAAQAAAAAEHAMLAVHATSGLVSMNANPGG